MDKRAIPVAAQNSLEDSVKTFVSAQLESDFNSALHLPFNANFGEREKIQAAFTPQVFAFNSREPARSHAVAATGLYLAQEELRRKVANQQHIEVGTVATALADQGKHSCLLIDGRDEARLHKVIANPTVSKEVRDISRGLLLKNNTAKACSQGVENCDYRSPIAIANHCYFDFDSLPTIFRKHDINIMYLALTMPKTVEELDSSFDDAYDIGFHTRGETTTMYFTDGALAYQHPTKLWKDWMTRNISRSATGAVLVENYRNYGRVRMFCCTRMTKSVTASKCVPVLKEGMVQILDVLQDYKRTANVLCASPREEALATLKQTCRSFYLPRTVYDNAIAFGVVRQDTNFKREQIATYVKSTSSQIIIGGANVRTAHPIQAGDFASIVSLLFLKACIERQLSTKSIGQATKTLQLRSTLWTRITALFLRAFQKAYLEDVKPYRFLKSRAGRNLACILDFVTVQTTFSEDSYYGNDNPVVQKEEETKQIGDFTSYTTTPNDCLAESISVVKYGSRCYVKEINEQLKDFIVPNQGLVQGVLQKLPKSITQKIRVTNKHARPIVNTATHCKHGNAYLHEPYYLDSTVVREWVQPIEQYTHTPYEEQQPSNKRINKQKFKAISNLLGPNVNVVCAAPGNDLSYINKKKNLVSVGTSPGPLNAQLKNTTAALGKGANYDFNVTCLACINALPPGDVFADLGSAGTDVQVIATLNMAHTALNNSKRGYVLKAQRFVQLMTNNTPGTRRLWEEVLRGGVAPGMTFTEVFLHNQPQAGFHFGEIDKQSQGITVINQHVVPHSIRTDVPNDTKIEKWFKNRNGTATQLMPTVEEKETEPAVEEETKEEKPAPSAPAAAPAKPARAEVVPDEDEPELPPYSSLDPLPKPDPDRIPWIQPEVEELLYDSEQKENKDTATDPADEEIETTKCVCGLTEMGLPPMPSGVEPIRFRSNIQRNKEFSNFAAAPVAIEHDGVTYNFLNVEAAYQAQKNPTPANLELYAAKTGIDAFTTAKLNPKRYCCNAKAQAVMFELLTQKFAALKYSKVLCSTKGPLAEENRDPRWAYDNGNGANWLGRMLMLIRDKETAAIPTYRSGERDVIVPRSVSATEPSSLIDVKGDGNCLPRSLAVQLFNNEERWKEFMVGYKKTDDDKKDGIYGVELITHVVNNTGCTVRVYTLGTEQTFLGVNRIMLSIALSNGHYKSLPLAKLNVMGGDLTKVDGNLAHQCHAKDTGAGGLAAAFVESGHNPYAHRVAGKVVDQLGSFGQTAYTGRVVYDLYAQEHGGGVHGASFSADGYAQRLNYLLIAISKLPTNATLHLPARIGCGIAGGCWEVWQNQLDRVYMGAIQCHDDTLTNCDACLVDNAYHSKDKKNDGKTYSGALLPVPHVPFNPVGIKISATNATKYLNACIAELHATEKPEFKDMHDAAASSIKSLLPLTEDVDVKIRAISGVPGCGKTTRVKQEFNKDQWIVITPYARLSSGYKEEGWTARTFMAGMPSARGKNIILDEVYAMPPGVLTYYCLVASKLVVIGDPRQMHNVDERKRYAGVIVSDIIPWRAAGQMNVSHTVPPQTAASLNKHFGYNMTTTNNRLNTVHYRSGIAPTARPAFCFTTDMSRRNQYTVVASIQGTRTKETHLFVEANAKKLITDLPGQLVVALSRHSEQLFIYHQLPTMVTWPGLQPLKTAHSCAIGAIRHDYSHSLKYEYAECAFESKEVPAVTVAPVLLEQDTSNKSRLRQQIAEEMGVDSVTLKIDRYEMDTGNESPSRAINVDLKDVGINVVEAHSFTPHSVTVPVEENNYAPNFDHAAYDLLDYEVNLVAETPPTFSEIESILDEVGPAYVDSSTDNYGYAHTIFPAPDNFLVLKPNCKEPVGSTPLYELRRMPLAMRGRPTISQNQSQALYCALTRYGQNSRLFGFSKARKASHALFDSVQGAFRNSQPPQVTTDLLSSCLAEQVDAIAMRNKTQHLFPYDDQLPDTSIKISAFLKNQVKKDLAENAVLKGKDGKLKAGQGISAQPKAVNMIVGAAVRAVEKLAVAHLRPEYLFGYGLHPTVLSDTIEAMNLTGDEKGIEIDIEQFDKQRGLWTDLYMDMIYEQYGLNTAVIRYMSALNVEWVLDSQNIKLLVKEHFQSGRADTLFSNTMVSLAYFKTFFNTQDLKLLVVQGDDVTVLAKTVKYVGEHGFFKINNSDLPLFTGCILYKGLHLDIVSMSCKLANRAFTSDLSVENYRLAVKDWLSLVHKQGKYNTTLQVNAIKYQLNVDQIASLFSFLRTFANGGMFKNYKDSQLVRISATPFSDESF